MKVIFFGTPLFAANILSFLIENRILIDAIVTKPDKPQGRSEKLIYSTVKKRAIDAYPEIPIFQPERASDPAFAKKLRSFEADLFVVVAYGEIIKKNLLEMPRLGCINLHASLLPKYRGAAPMQFTLLNGDQETGVTIIEMTEKMDAGDILAQETIPIPEEMNLEELELKLLEVGCSKLLEVIQNFERGEIHRVSQDHRRATYVQKIDSSMAQLDWKEPSRALHNRIRAFSPKPGAWCLVKLGKQIKRLKILKSRICSDLQGEVGKTVAYDRKRWIIACGKEALQLLEVQLEGKKRMMITDFLIGHPFPPIIQV